MKFTQKQIERFWNRVNKTNSCWEWQGFKGSGGYGQVSLYNKVYTTHRLSAMLDGKDIDNKLVCHHCDNPSCVNPEHLFVGSPADNMQDKVNKGRQTRHIGSKNPMSKLNEADVKTIISLYTNKTLSIPKIAKKYNVDPCVIYGIKAKKYWKHVER